MSRSFWVDNPAKDRGRIGDLAGQSRRRIFYVLLVVPFAALLWVPLYAKSSPELFGFPFFYWWMFLWVPLAALITWIVYMATRPPGGGDDDRGTNR
jgi:hypothetical protein